MDGAAALSESAKVEEGVNKIHVGKVVEILSDVVPNWIGRVNFPFLGGVRVIFLVFWVFYGYSAKWLEERPERRSENSCKESSDACGACARWLVSPWPESRLFMGPSIVARPFVFERDALVRVCARSFS